MSRSFKKNLVTHSLGVLGVASLAVSPILAISGNAFAADPTSAVDYNVPVSSTSSPLFVLNGDLENQKNAVDSIDFNAIFKKDSLLKAGEYTVQYENLHGTPVTFSCKLDVNGKLISEQKETDEIVAFEVKEDTKITDEESGISCEGTPTTLEGAAPGKELFNQGKVTFSETKDALFSESVYSVFGDNDPIAYDKDHQLPEDLSTTYEWGEKTEEPAEPSKTPTPSATPTAFKTENADSPVTNESPAPAPTMDKTPTATTITDTEKTPAPEPEFDAPVVPGGSVEVKDGKAVLSYKGLNKDSKYVITTSVKATEGEPTVIETEFTATGSEGTVDVDLSKVTTTGKHQVTQEIRAVGATEVVFSTNAEWDNSPSSPQPSATETPSNTPTPSATPTPTPSEEPTGFPVPDGDDTPTPTPSPSATETPSSTPSPSANDDESPAPSPSPSATATTSKTPLPNPIGTPAPSPSVSTQPDDQMIDTCEGRFLGIPKSDPKYNPDLDTDNNGIACDERESNMTGTTNTSQFPGLTNSPSTTNTSGGSNISGPSNMNPGTTATSRTQTPTGSNYTTTRATTPTGSTYNTNTGSTRNTSTQSDGLPKDTGLNYYDSTLVKTGSDTGTGVLAASGTALALGGLLFGAGYLKRRKAALASIENKDN